MSMQQNMVIDTKGIGGINFPWAADQTTIALPPAGGICSQWSFDDDNALSYIRYATVYWSSAPVAAFTPPATSPLVFAPSAGRGLIAFSDGVGDAANLNTGKIIGVANGQGTALALTYADTNAEEQGSLVPFSTSWFLSQGMGIEFGQAGVFDNAGYWNVAAHTSFYEEKIVRALADRIVLSMAYEGTKITNDLGLARQYPAQSQMSNADDIATVGTPMIGSMMVFPFPFFSGSRCSCNLMNIFASLDEGVVIANDSNSATVAGEIITVPMTIELYGRTFCLDALAAAAAQTGVALPGRFFAAS